MLEHLARKTNTEKAGSNNPWNACRYGTCDYQHNQRERWPELLRTANEPLLRIMLRIEERSRARPPVLSPLPLKANTETSDEMCSTVIATPTNRAGIVLRGVASRLTISTAAPWSKTSSKICGTQRESDTPLASIEFPYPVLVNMSPGPKTVHKELKVDRCLTGKTTCT